MDTACSIVNVVLTNSIYVYIEVSKGYKVMRNTLGNHGYLEEYTILIVALYSWLLVTVSLTKISKRVNIICISERKFLLMV
jgi:hypothetical protein